MPKAASKSQTERIALAKAGEFKLVDSFKIGYRNREEITMLPPGVLVEGSKNVVTNTSGRVGMVKGYSLDGSASVVLAPIKSGMPIWKTSKGYERNLRAGFLLNNDGKLQFRYDDNGTIRWVDLLTGLTSVDFNFADFWDFNTEKIALLLMVNGTSSIYEWSGATATFGSATTNTIVIGDPTTTWGQEGFLTQGTRKVTIGTTDYTYTGGESTTTLTGVTPDPTLGGYSAGALIFQTIRTTAASTVASLGLSTVAVIGASLNQIYYGNLQRNDVYASKVNNYKDCAFGTPRLPGEGALFNLGTPIVGFAPQEGQMYMSAGLDEWYLTQFTLSSDLTKESLSVGKLKTGARQGAQTQSLITKDKNSVVFVSNEPTLSSLGRVENIFQTPQIVDVSFSIINDMNAYDFTDGSTYYWKNFVFMAVPRSSIVRIYNKTDPQAQYWEAPVEYPITGFYEVDGDLYGHGYLTSESYKLFDGYNFNTHPIEAIALFSYQNFGVRSQTKSFDEFYQEGRCTQNGVLKTGVIYETDGFMTDTEYEMDGNSKYVAVPTDQNSLGKFAFGKQPLGTNISNSTLPPKFRKIITFTKTPFYEYQPKFSSFDKDFVWELIAFGPEASLTSEGNNDIKD